MPRLLILSRDAGTYRGLLEAARLPDLDIIATTDPAEAAGMGARCDVALGEPSLLRHVLAALPGLRWVQSTWAGVEPLLDPALRRDYVLTSVRGIFGAQMTEYVFGYLLAREQRIFDRAAAQHAGRWDQIRARPLRGRTLGLLGVGSIGAALAGAAKHFGMKVRGYTRASEDCPDVDAYFHGPDLLGFADGLDYAVGILPGTSRTRHLVDAEFLAALPPTAVLVNVGRGSLVDEAALAEALRTRQIAGAVLDVFEREPLPSDHVFWRTPNLLLTAHTAAVSFPEDIAPIFLENYGRFRRGEPLPHRVDFERGY